MVEHSFGYFIDYNLILAVAVPISIFLIGIGRHFWKKEKCFTKMANTIKRLEAQERDDTEKHDGYDERLKALEDDAIQIKIYLKLLLDKEGIKYD